MPKGIDIDALLAGSAEEIAAAIKAGQVTLYELSKSGNLTPLKKRKIEEALSRPAPAVPPAPEAAGEPEAPAPSFNPVAPPPPVPEPDPVTPESEPDPAPSVQQHSPKMFQRPFSFKGRIRRTEYWLSGLIYGLFYGLMDFIFLVGAEFIDEGAEEGGLVLVAISLLLFVPLTWFALSQNARRCHDLGHSGWWQLIPFYGFWLAFQNSRPGPNEYGECPKIMNA